MKHVKKVLDKYKFLNYLMFGFTSLSTVMGVVLGWNQFYKDYLAVEVAAPVWLILLGAVLFFIIAIVVLAFKGKAVQDHHLMEVVGQEFGVQRIDVNGKHFKRCRFHGTELLLNVDQGFGLEYCEFIEPRFTWGDHGSKVIQAMTVMYKEPALRELIARSLENIVSDKTPQATNPKEL